MLLRFRQTDEMVTGNQRDEMVTQRLPVTISSQRYKIVTVSLRETLRPLRLRGAHWVYLVDMLTLLQGKAILCYTPVIICRSGHATKPNVVSQITSLQRPTQLKLVGARPLLRSVVAQFTVVDQKE